MEPSDLLVALLRLPYPPDAGTPLPDAIGGLLLNQFDGEYRLLYAQSDNFFTPNDYTRYFQALAGFRARFDHVVAHVAQEWGQPRYLNNDLARQKWEWDVDPPTFDHDVYWRGGMALAWWELPDGIAYVELEHADKELPFMLFLGVRARISERG